AEGRERVVHCVDRAVGGGGRGRCPKSRVRDTEARFLALHVAARLHRRRGLIHAQPGKERIASLLRAVAEGEQDDENYRHCREYCPPLARVTHHPPEGPAERCGNQEYRQQFQEVRKRRRVLKGMGGVDVEEAAAVRAELLDRYLRRCRAYGDDLLSGDGLLHDWLALVVLQR